MTKIEGSGSGSISQRHGSPDPDPDPYQNVTDPQHWFLIMFSMIIKMKNSERNVPNLSSLIILPRFLFFPNKISSTGMPELIIRKN
jgi:hypothetical protein